MEIIPYTEDWREKWDNFVLNSNTGNMFHLQRFFDYHPPGRFKFHHLMFIEKGEIAAVLPGSSLRTEYMNHRSAPVMVLSLQKILNSKGLWSW